MKSALEAIRARALERLQNAEDLTALEEARVQLLGKKGELTAILKTMGQLSPEERPVMGQMANEVRAAIEEKLAARGAALKAAMAEQKLKMETIDVTLPGKPVREGHRHPLNLVLDEIKEIFLGMGFDVVSGPEVELDYYNFEALNLPPDHPARDTQDTFYITDKVLLRTQTSPVQIRTMEQRKPPIRIIAPGRVYRSDAVDATHSPIFHQIEGLVVDEGITMRFHRALPSAPLPLHRTLRRGRCPVLCLPWQGLPHLQGRRLDRNSRLRHGTPQGAGRLRTGPRKVQRLRVRHRPGAHRYAPLCCR